MQEFKSTWWKVRLPDNWFAEPDESHVSIARPSGPGVLNVSCIKKERGTVSSDDLRNWAAEQENAQVPWVPAQFDTLSGLGRKRVNGSTMCLEWYLGCGHLLYFVTYHCPLGREAEELGDVTRIISGIEPERSGA